MEKVYFKKAERQLDYATPQYLKDFLLSLKAKYDVPIRDAILLLNKGKVDSVSFSKNKPYFNFHATRINDSIWISIRESGQDIEFNTSLQSLEFCIM